MSNPLGNKYHNFVCRICGYEEYKWVFTGDFFNSQNVCLGCGIVFDNPKVFSLQAVKFFKMYPDVLTPIKAHSSDSGFDLFAYKEAVIQPGKIELISTGIKLQLPYNTDAQIRMRSSMGMKGLVMPNGVGTIDQGYVGELKVMLLNTTDAPFIIDKNIKVAQLVFRKCFPYKLEEIPEVEDTQRGEGGFGSTGE